MELVDKDKWITAMNEKYDSSISQKVWTVHDTYEVPFGRKLVGSKWVYTIKINKNGSIERFKARLVVKGYSQIPRLDYNKTFTPVTRYDSLHLITARAAQFNVGTSQLDIKLAFTNGDLDEDIWFKPPPGIGLDDKALYLNQALYGLKQAPKQQYIKLCSVLREAELIPSDFDPYVFLHPLKRLFIYFYVNDISVVGDDADRLVLRHLLVEDTYPSMVLYRA